MNLDSPWEMARAVAELEQRLGSLPPGSRVITIGGALYVLDQEHKRGSRARGDHPNSNFDRVFESIGWRIEVVDEPESRESLSPGSTVWRVAFGLLCGIVALGSIAVGVEGCREKFGLEPASRGINMELIKERAHAEACIEHMKKTEEVPLECERYKP